MPQKNATVADVNRFLCWQTLFMVLFAFPTLPFFREKPKFPPSTLKITVTEHSVWQEFKELIKIKNFVLLTITFGFMTCIYDLIALLIDPLTANVDYTGPEKSLLAVIFCVFGSIGLVIIKFMLDQYKLYNFSLRLFSFGSVGVLVVALLTLRPLYWPFCITICFAGFFIIPDTAVCLAFAGEATYPSDQTMVNGIISLCGHGLAGVISFPAIAIA